MKIDLANPVPRAGIAARATGFVPAVCPEPSWDAVAATVIRSRRPFAAYVELTKPRVAILVLFTVAAGYLLGVRGPIALSPLVNTLLGTALVAAGASALNQLLERKSDARMRRTENRSLPAGRLGAVEVAVFGFGLAATGLIYVALTVQQPLTSLVLALTFLSYVFVYTPLKRWTAWNTVIGAVPGALPPIIGWTAATGGLDSGAAILFGILFFWQLPHFFSIAWIYRDDYAQAGLKMLSVDDPTGTRTARQMFGYALALIAASIAPVIVNGAGWIFGIGALLQGGYFLYAIALFCRHRNEGEARRVLRASLIYLPAMLALLLVARYFPVL